MATEINSKIDAVKIGYYSSIIMALITLITFGFAITAVPISGEFCVKDCIEYPYTDTLSHYPKDYIWMYLALPLILSYLINFIAIHSTSEPDKKTFGRIGLSFAAMASVILLGCYFVQFTVIPASLSNGETDGIALLTQYNPHGIFIALEELGYLLMSTSFLFIAFTFTKGDRLRNSIRWIYIVAFILSMVAFFVVMFKYGFRRDYRFEVMVISIDWLVLVVNGILSAVIFNRTLRQMELHQS